MRRGGVFTFYVLFLQSVKIAQVALVYDSVADVPYCTQGSGTPRQQLTIQHILHILRYLALSCAILHYLALFCTILYIRYTCSQQMSSVIAFDIAVVAQKVKVQY